VTEGPRKASGASRLKPECIRLRGVRQNNLKGFDLDVPLGRYVVVTGLSGAGKSSLVFEALHAEGQRRYVETFSAYTRQFLELLDKPRVDSIENIRPSIAIEQTNTVKSSRSTVGTMTELTDFFKVWFSHVAECFDPETGEKVEDDNPQSVWKKTLESHAGEQVMIAFEVRRPANIAWGEILLNLKNQAYVRVLAAGLGEAGLAVRRVDELIAEPTLLSGAERIFVVQDRMAVEKESMPRFTEAVETAMHFGRGEVRIFGARTVAELGHYSRGLHSPRTGRKFRPATPPLFSFNSPLGACPTCRGFGRIIEIDYRLAIPDPSLSIDGGAIRCWEGAVYSSSKDDLRKFTRKRAIPTDIPFEKLTKEQQAFVVDGEPGYGTEKGKEWPKAWYGVKGFFRWLEKNTYKMHVRVFLSRYRSYNTCPACGGSRMQPEALCWKWRGFTLPDLYKVPVDRLRALVGESRAAKGDRHAELAYESIMTRLRYLSEVGLGYLTPERPSRTLSGGEVERVNLTGCLGTSLVDTLFVMDEPSVGLHPRDIDKLVAIIRSLVDAGNTVVVVEHDEAMIRAADHVIEVGPEPGARGGNIVFGGTVPQMLRDGASVTGAYFSGRRRIEGRGARRPVKAAHPSLEFIGASKHNLKSVDVRIPLHRFVCLSGVSGSGKSTILDNVIHQGLLAHRGRASEDPAAIVSVRGSELVSEAVLVDQGPVSRTPRSNPALYVEAWDLIRELFAATPGAQAAGLAAPSFSFNGGNGRCDHCQGLGYERVEMQFLSDVFVPCPVCEGRRFKPEVLAIEWNGLSVSSVLEMNVTDAMRAFEGCAQIRHRLSSLESVGLGYLCLGQPLNTLSGGESQRLKLVRYLGAIPGGANALLLLDEPTTGLHRHDVGRLLGVLHALVEKGHSLVVIEHNVDVLKSADWILEVGPDAGDGGGRIVAEGTPEAVSKAGAATSPFLLAALDEEMEPSAAVVAMDSPVEEAKAPVAALEVVGARENNLKGLSVSIPLRTLAVVTGVSGSGKSTLAFDIIFAEGQRRFMESMSPYARQFVEQMPRPAIDRLTGIPPTVAIEQRVTRGSLKSTVATITEVAQYLRLLYARLGVQHHPETDRPVTPLSHGALRKLLMRVLATAKARRSRNLYLCAPLVRGRKGHHQPIADWIGRQGYTLMRADGKILRVDAFRKLDRYKEHDIEAVVADLKGNPAPGQALELALREGKGSCFLANPTGAVLSWFSATRTDIETGESFPELDPKDFSFNSSRGWCPTCRGYGRIYPWMAEPDDERKDENTERLRQLGLDGGDERGEGGTPCPDCHGERLNRISRSVKLHFKGKRAPLSLPALLGCPPAELISRLESLDLDPKGLLVTRDIVPQIRERLKFMGSVGLGYLSLDRPTKTLSGGEAQRIRLAAQLGTNLAGVLYVLDEPSIGLHARDNMRLIATLLSLRDKGNTLVVVEHDDELMSHADLIIDLGPGAGVHGGKLLALGSPAEIRRNDSSITGIFLARGLRHPQMGSYRGIGKKDIAEPWIELTGACLRNLGEVNLRIPPGRLTLVAGPSGAGKSTLFRDVLGPAVAHAIKTRSPRVAGRAFARASKEAKPNFAELRNAQGYRSVIEVDQSPIGRTPRSTPATYLGIFDLIRKFFASLPESKIRGYTASRFSFNTVGGRCPTCEGAGRIRLEMAFMPDTYLPCDDCQGLRYGPELSDVAWKGLSIGAVLRLTFEEAAGFFSFHSELSQVCRLMADCGLGYLTLGQSSSTLSGGEAQRLKLVTELSKGLATYRERSRGSLPRNLYILEEPTIGLHLSDCEKLIGVLQSLVGQGHTVIVIEHNLDLIAEADYVVEMGPGGGPDGGRLIYQGALAGLLKSRRSPTAPFLRKKLRGPKPDARRAGVEPEALAAAHS
jgi:excinuclease ABC subunit A